MENDIPILVCSSPPEISENIVDMRKRIFSAMEQVKSTPKTKEGLASVKELRAKLRADFEVMEAQRKAVKKAVLGPYEEANEHYKNLIAYPMSQADDACKCFVEEVQNSFKAACEAELRKYFGELVTSYNIPWLTFDRAGLKIDMATAQKKDYKKERVFLFEFVKRVSDDLQVISEMENAVDILENYIRTLDLTSAMAYAKFKNERRMEAESIRNSVTQKAEADRAHDAVIASAMGEPTPQEKTFSCTFTVTATIARLRGLKAFLDGNHYEYTEET